MASLKLFLLSLAAQTGGGRGTLLRCPVSQHLLPDLCLCSLAPPSAPKVGAEGSVRTRAVKTYTSLAVSDVQNCSGFPVQQQTILFGRTLDILVLGPGIHQSVQMAFKF